jgi:SAM-dependent methyltransferase
MYRTSPGETYDAQSTGINAEVGQYLPCFLKEMKWGSGEKILDHGCGTGQTLTEFILPKAKETSSKVYGVDISASKIKYAKANYSDSSVEYVQSDLLSKQFPLKDQKFDKVFSIYTLSYIEEAKETVSQIYNLLAPGGYFVLIDCVDSAHFKLGDILLQDENWGGKGKKVPGIPHWHNYEEGHDHQSRFNDMLKAAKFNVLKSEISTSDFTYGSKAELADFIIANDPHKHELHLENAENFRKLESDLVDLLGELEKQGKVTGGTGNGDEYQVQATTVFVLAQKPE